MVSDRFFCWYRMLYFLCPFLRGVWWLTGSSCNFCSWLVSDLAFAVDHYDMGSCIHDLPTRQVHSGLFSAGWLLVQRTRCVGMAVFDFSFLSIWPMWLHTLLALPAWCSSSWHTFSTLPIQSCPSVERFCILALRRWDTILTLRNLQLFFNRKPGPKSGLGK